MLLEDRWSFRPRLGEEGARKMTELMVVQLEDRLSCRPRLGGRGQGEDRIYGVVAGGQVELVLLEDMWSSWPRLVLEAGRERTEFMVVLLEDSWSSRLAVGGAGRGHK